MDTGSPLAVREFFGLNNVAHPIPSLPTLQSTLDWCAQRIHRTRYIHIPPAMRELFASNNVAQQIPSLPIPQPILDWCAKMFHPIRYIHIPSVHQELFDSIVAQPPSPRTLQSILDWAARAVHFIRTKPITSILVIAISRWAFTYVFTKTRQRDDDELYPINDSNRTDVRESQVARLTLENAQLRDAYASRISAGQHNHVMHDVAVLREDVYALRRENHKLKENIKQVSFRSPLAQIFWTPTHIPAVHYSVIQAPTPRST